MLYTSGIQLDALEPKINTLANQINQIENNNASIRNNNNIIANELNTRKSNRTTINLTKLTLYLSLISIISHTVVFVTFIGFFFVTNPIFVNHLIALTFFSLNLKHALNFFVLYNFDRNFKRIFKEIISRIH